MEHCFVNWPQLLEYLKVLLAWPPLAFGTLVAALFLFRQELAALINRVQSMKGFGAEVSSPLTNAQEPRDGVPLPPTGNVTGAATTAATPGQPHNYLAEIAADPKRAADEIL